MIEPLKGIVFTMGCPICPTDCIGREIFPATCVLITLPPGIVARGFELNIGFQPKGLLKGTEVVMLVGGATVVPNDVMVGVDTKGFGKLLTVVLTIGLGVGMC